MHFKIETISALPTDIRYRKLRLGADRKSGTPVRQPPARCATPFRFRFTVSIHQVLQGTCLESGKHANISKQQHWHTSSSIIRAIHPSAPPKQHPHPHTHPHTCTHTTLLVTRLAPSLGYPLAFLLHAKTLSYRSFSVQKNAPDWFWHGRILAHVFVIVVWRGRECIRACISFLFSLLWCENCGLEWSLQRSV